MYNEPNIVFWRPKPNVTDYVKACARGCKAMRQATPGETLIGPATGIDFAFLEACFQRGLARILVGSLGSSYRQTDPGDGLGRLLSTAPIDCDVTRLLSEPGAVATGPRLSKRQKEIPIISGEWGYSSAWRGMNEEKQGERLARQWLTNAANGVQISIWYDWPR